MTFIARITAITVAVATSAASAAEAAPDYTKDIAPLLATYCNGCHNGADREGKLSLEKYDELLKGGAGGVVVVPGQPSLSRLLLLVEAREQPVMPPEGNEAPKSEEVALLRRWIEAGAKGPSGAAPDPTILVTPQVKLTAPARDALSAVAVSPTQPIAAIGAYREVRIVGLDDQAVERTISGLRGPVVDLEFSRDGKLLATAAGEPGVFGEAQLWNTADGKLVRTFTGHRDSLYAVALSPDAKTLATASYDQMIILWDATTGKERKTLAGHNGAVFDLAFSPDGNILASAGADRTVKLWDTATGARLDTFSQATKEQYAVAFSPDGKTVAAGGADNRIRTWSISPTAKENTNPLTVTRFAHEGAIIKLTYSADGKTLVSSGEDRMVRIWNAATIMERAALEKQPDVVPGLALTKDAAMLAVGRMDGSFVVYDAKTGMVKPPAPPEIAMVSPRGILRGTPTTVTLTGKNLGAVQKLTLRDAAGKPVEAKAKLIAEGRSATSVRFELSADAKLPRGSYQLVVATPAAKSKAAAIEVDDLPQVVEVEPNDSAPKTAPTALEAGYWGLCSKPGDVDHYRFVAKRGQTIVCRVEAKSHGSMLNGFVTVLDPTGQVVATNNDFDDQQDPLVAYLVPADGIYTVRVNDQSMAGGPQHFYRASIGTFPLVTGVFPLNVPVGRESRVELTGYNLPAGGISATVKPMEPSDVVVPYDMDKLRVVKAPRVRATAEVEIAEVEPNDAAGKPQAITVPGHFNGRIFATGGNAGADVDYVRFESKKGQNWIIETEAQRRGSPVDTKIEILTTDGKPVPRVLLQAVRDSYVTFRSIDSGSLECRLFNWEEMELNEYLYMSGEVLKMFRKPRGPDSGFEFYQSAGRRRTYFDTSSAGHAVDEAAYIVEPHPVGTKLIYNGLPTFTVNYVNDDDALRTFGADSRLTFTAPADGAYVVRVSDVRGFGGDHFNYRLAIREPKPDFTARLSTNNPTVAKSGGTAIGVSVERVDGFDGEIAIDVEGLPPGYAVSKPVTIEAGHDNARLTLFAAGDAMPAPAEAWAKVKVSSLALVAGRDVVKPLEGFKTVTLEEPSKLQVSLEPAELTIAPGSTVKAKLKLVRNGFNERVAFDVANLPHGVIVDNIGLNGILIPENQTEREIFLRCDSWVPETTRACFAETKTPRAGGGKVQFEASAPMVLHVRKPSPLAKAETIAPTQPAAATK
jgi:hypothetical protein